MKTPIIEGVTQAGLESYLAARQYDALYWPNFFPLKDVNSLDGKTLIGAVGSRVAAHVISYDAKAPEASRKSLSTLFFDIPKVAQSRRKTEKDILEHAITRSLRGQDAVIEDYFNDLDFVWDSVQARMEWYSLIALSATKLQLSTTNNPQGIINETVIDFGMPTANKKYASVIWSTGNVATMDPIADFQAIVAAARKKGIKFQRMLMNADTYDLMVAATKFRAYFTNASSIVVPINLAAVNMLLADYNLPQISVVETSVGIEAKSATITATDPWSASHITFVPELRCGDMFNGPIAEQIEKPDGVLLSMKGNVSMSIRRESNPVSVLTKAECNVFPSWTNVDRCYSLYTASDSAWA
jgi:hypothetical protein